MSRRRQLYEGKAKVLFEGPEPGTLVQYFKDDATAFNNQKRGTITGKGVLNNRISEYLMTKLNEIGVPNHFIRRLNMREQLVKEVEIIPIEVVVRNVAAGSISSRLGIAEGTTLPRSIVEFYYKNDALNDPMVSEEHITCFGWGTAQEIDEIMSTPVSDTSVTRMPKQTTYSARKPHSACTTDSGMRVRPSLIWITACGWIRRRSSRLPWRNSSSMRTTLMPPPLVDPAQPLISMPMINRMPVTGGHRL